MDELERKLKALPLRKPTEELRGRIFENRPARRLAKGATKRSVRGFHRQISLAWAAMLCMTTGLGGFAAARFLSEEQAAPPPIETTSVQIHIIEATSAQNVFDFSEPTDDFLPGKLNVRVETGNEV